MGNRRVAQEFYNHAVSAANDKSQPSHLQHSYQLFSSACMADPTWSAAFYQSGNNNSDLGMVHAAVANYRRALECNEGTDEDKAKIWTNLSWRLHTLSRTEECIDAARQAIALAPHLPLPHLNLSLGYGALCDSKNAVLAARQCYALDPNDTHTSIALAFALLFDGQYAEGFKFFEKRFEWRLHNFMKYPYPKWEGEPDKTVFLVADQGLGDTLSFARFVDAASHRAKYIHMVVQSELMRLFTHAFSHLPNINILPMGSSFQDADAWTTFVSLPYALKLDDETIRTTPHIRYPAFQAPTNWMVPDRKLHIGIAWAGSPMNDIDKYRNIPFPHFLELYRCPGIQLYSLQADDRKVDLQNNGANAVVKDLAPYLRDVCDTLAILPDLDMVITVESALGHIAGLAGKETWVPYSYGGRDYRLGYDGSRILWYPGHRTVNQGPDCRWEPVFDEIVDLLKDRPQDDTARKTGNVSSRLR